MHNIRMHSDADGITLVLRSSLAIRIARTIWLDVAILMPVFLHVPSEGLQRLTPTHDLSAMQICQTLGACSFQSCKGIIEKRSFKCWELENTSNPVHFLALR